MECVSCKTLGEHILQTLGTCLGLKSYLCKCLENVSCKILGKHILQTLGTCLGLPVMLWGRRLQDPAVESRWRCSLGSSTSGEGHTRITTGSPAFVGLKLRYEARWWLSDQLVKLVMKRLLLCLDIKEFVQRRGTHTWVRMCCRRPGARSTFVWLR